MDADTTTISVNEIIPNLWLGNQASSQSDKFIKLANIKAIVNATSHIPNAFPDRCAYFRIDVGDPGPNSSKNQDDVRRMSQILPHALRFIHYHLQKGEAVLVHCHAGIQRSATTVLLYLYTHIYTGPNKVRRIEQSFRKILRERPKAFYEGRGASFHHAIVEYVRNY